MLSVSKSIKEINSSLKFWERQLLSQGAGCKDPLRGAARTGGGTQKVNVQLLKKFQLSSPKGQEGSDGSIKPAVMRGSPRPQPSPKSLPKKLPAALPAGPGSSPAASGCASPTPARAS